MSFCLPPNMGWIFNTIVAANITGEATHRRATCGNASNPCTIKAVSVIGVARSASCRGRYIGESPSRGEDFGAGQSRPVVLMSVLGGDRDVVELGHAISHAGFSRRTAIGLSSRRPLAAPDRQVALQVMPGGRRGGLGQINLVAWFPKADCCAARRRSVIPGPEAPEYLQ